MEVVGWSLLHSVWQGVLVALLLWATLRVVRDTAPRARYVAGLVALAVLLVLPVLTYCQTVEVWRGHRSWLVKAADAVIQGQLADGPPDPSAVTAELRRRHASVWGGETGPVAVLAQAGREPVRVLVWLWLGGALLLAVRLGRDSRRARSLAESGVPAPEWRAACRAVSGRLAIDRPVRVRTTDAVDVPALVGWRWPVVLVPRTLRPDSAERESILAHELAHVRRHDSLVNLLQAVAEVLLFYSPAAWWISSRIREERECSCDATAVPAVAGGPTRYARTLLRLETARVTGGRALAMSDGPLLRRVRRVLDRARDPRPVHWRNAVALGLLLAAVWTAAPPARHPVPLAARLSATSLMLRDLDTMRVVVRIVRVPAPSPDWAASFSATG